MLTFYKENAIYIHSTIFALPLSVASYVEFSEEVNVKDSHFIKVHVSSRAASRAHAGVKKSGSGKVMMMTSTTSFIPRQASGAVSAFLLD